MIPDISTKHIELNTFLRIVGIEGTGGKIRQIIRSGSVKVNGEIETRNKRKLKANDIVEYLGKKHEVEEKLTR
ncbi:RNA-binding S4 domain-containing protein [Candidatus Woesearchaeota archaeon]|nr:RNA-binding S4 domain-containing protein [Candidatus Woesearchaeota archaeon]